MYQDVVFVADLNEVGLEVWSDLIETKSWGETAERLSHYAFLEHVERAGTWIRPITTWPGVSLSGNRLTVDTTKCDCSLKDRGGDIDALLRLLLGPIVLGPVVVVRDHEITGHWETTVEPVRVEPDWFRKYGDPTGI